MIRVPRIGLVGICVAVVSVGLSAPAFAEARSTTKAQCDKLQTAFGHRQSCQVCIKEGGAFVVVANKNTRCEKKK